MSSGGSPAAPMLINRWRYAELAAEGFVCRVDRMRDVLGVAAAVDLAQRDRADGGVVPQRGLDQAVS